MKEASADEKLINIGLRSRTEIRRERYGDEWSDVAETLAEEKKLMEKLDILPESMKPPEPPVGAEGGAPPKKPKEKEKKDKARTSHGAVAAGKTLAPAAAVAAAAPAAAPAAALAAAESMSEDDLFDP